MNLLKQRIARFGIGIGLAATMALGAVVPALADDNTLTVTGGALSITPAVGATSSANLSGGGDKTASYNIGLTISDARGSGDGWSVSLTSTAFSGASGEATGHSLANDASTIASRPDTTCSVGSTCAVATDSGVGSVSYPYTIPADTSAPTATKVYRAVADSGMGNMTTSLPVTIGLPAGTTYAGTYVSTITVTSAAAP
jgi:hypothetical protein